MIEIRRHKSIFNPALHEAPVLVAGCGATGSHVALQLACLGVQQMTVVDDDTVEEHNLANQIFAESDLGEFKCVALLSHIVNKVGTQHSTEATVGILPDVGFPPRLPGLNGINPVLILAVDTMQARRQIVEALKIETMGKVNWRVIDTRMAATHGNVYSFDLHSQYDKWVRTLVDDSQAEASPCGAAITVIPTVQVTAGLAVWEYIKHCTDTEAITEITDFFLKPTCLATRSFPDEVQTAE